VLLPAAALASALLAALAHTGAAVLAQRVGAQTASHAGLSFSYDAALGSRVRGEVAPGGQCGKPGDVMPEHLAFTFEGYPKPHASPFMRPPEIQVFPIAAYRRALAACEKEMARSIVRRSAPLSYVSDFEGHVRTLRALSAERPAPRRLGAWLRRQRVREHFRGRMPFVPMYDISEALRAKVGYLDFRGGRGVRFVAQYNIEDTLVSNRALTYVFQGITDDGAYYVSAAFPIAAPFLPAEYTEEEAARRGIDSPVMVGPVRRRLYKNYLAENTRLLEALAPGKYRPGLGLLDDLVRSLAVDRAALAASLDPK
jgi:hypothetical protein